MNKTVLRALLTLFGAALITVQSLLALPTAYGTNSVLGGPYSIGAAKAVTSITQQGNGTYDITYVLVVKNFGANTLYNVQVTDNLQNTFQSPATFTVTTAPVASGTLAANVSFNGSGTVNLLNSGSSTLAPGAQETIVFTVNVGITGASAVFYNTAIANGTDMGGSNAVADSSDWGTNPDSDLDGQPNELGENTPTPTILSANAITTIGAAKTIIDTSVTNCVYNVTYQVIVRNLGTETLENIQAVDDLALTFPSPITFSVSNLSATNGLAINNGFTGNGSNNLLDAANSTLAFGQTGVITYTVALTLNGSCGQYFNSSTVTAVGQTSGLATLDISDWGTNPDPDLDGNPNEPNQAENDPTPFVIICPQVAVAKYVDTKIANPDGSYTVNYVIAVQNTGTTDINNIQVTDNLSTTFPTPVSFNVGNLDVQSPLTPNYSFSTSANWNLLSNGSVLPAGETRTIKFSVFVDLNNTADTLFNNSAIATAQSDCGSAAVDTSNNGAGIDPPSSVPTPVVLLPTLTKIPGGFSPNSDSVNDFFVITNIGGKKVSVQIFNRWGAAVYKNDAYDNSWNGSANTGFGLGEDLPTGTYWYVIKIDDSKEVKEYADYLTLTR